jgi:hypothetical protein
VEVNELVTGGKVWPAIVSVVTPAVSAMMQVAEVGLPLRVQFICMALMETYVSTIRETVGVWHYELSGVIVSKETRKRKTYPLESEVVTMKARIVCQAAVCEAQVFNVEEDENSETILASLRFMLLNRRGEEWLGQK